MKLTFLSLVATASYCLAIRATGQDASRCNDHPKNWLEAADYSVSDVTSSVDEDGVACNIGSLVPNQPQELKKRSPARGSSGSSGSSNSNGGSENATTTTAAAATPSPTGNSSAGPLLAGTTWASLMGMLLVFLHL